ncbi:MAG: hypothetical protein AAF614_08380 [Chloroflexota bacterium]
MSNLQERALEGLALYNQGQYPEARQVFHNILDKSENYLWVHAHLGETYAAIAKTNQSSEHYCQSVQLALRHFSRAIGLPPRAGDSNQFDLSSLQHLPAQMPSNSRQEQEARTNLAWAWAHLGELLRSVANQSWRVNNNLLTSIQDAKLLPALKNSLVMGENSAHVGDVYNIAIVCFTQAIKYRPDYAWAKAHMAATWCNSRQKEHYKDALKLLIKARNHQDGFYPWCTAYIACIYLLLDHMGLAFYNMYEAQIQDPTLASHSIHPYGQYNSRPPFSVLYGISMSEYSNARRLDLELSTRYYFQKYYRFVFQTLQRAAIEKHGHNEFSPQEIENLPELIQAEDLAQEVHNASDLTHEAYKHYLQAAIQAAEMADFQDITSCPEQSDKIFKILKKAFAQQVPKLVKEKIRRFAMSDVAWYPYHQCAEFRNIVIANIDRES